MNSTKSARQAFAVFICLSQIAHSFSVAADFSVVPGDDAGLSQTFDRQGRGGISMGSSVLLAGLPLMSAAGSTAGAFAFGSRGAASAAGLSRRLGSAAAPGGSFEEILEALPHFVQPLQETGGIAQRESKEDLVKEKKLAKLKAEIAKIEGGKKDKKEDKKEAKPTNPFDEFIKGATVYQGLFTIYEVDPNKKTDDPAKKSSSASKDAIPGFFNDDETEVSAVAGSGVKEYYLEIRPDQLEKDYHFLPTLERGTGEYGVYSTLMLWKQEFAFFFRRVDNKIQFARRNTSFRAPSNEAAQKLLSSSFPDSSVIDEIGIEGGFEHPVRKSVLINMSSLFTSDLVGLNRFLSQAYGNKEKGISPIFLFNQGSSRLDSLEVYPQNIEILQTLVFKLNAGAMLPSISIPGGRAALLVRYSISALPDNGYEPREADDRVGTYMTVFQDYSDPNSYDPHVRFVERWHFEKKNPYEPLSEVKKQAVYYLDPNTPPEFKDFIAAGVLGWNKAFEKIGFKNALAVQDYPKDAPWKPGDTRYSMIRWFTGLGPVYAIGPWRASPLTGEIYQASISINDWMVRGLRRGLDFLPKFLKPEQELSKPLSDFAEVSADADGRFCRLSERLAGEVNLALALAETNGQLSEEERKRIVGQYLTELTEHEVGHTLGLRHNFKASTAFSLADIQGGKTGGILSGSVMDYLPINLPVKGADVKNHQYFQTQVGPYDEAAIAYSYTELKNKTPQEKKAALEEIAKRFSSDKNLVYGTDEDFVRADPSVMLWDLGDNGVAYQRARLDLNKEIWKDIEAGKTKDYKKARELFLFTLNQHVQALGLTRRHLGGIAYNRIHAGDASGKVPLEPVTAQKQREAMGLLNDYFLKPGALEFSPGLLSRLGPENLPQLYSWPQPKELPTSKVIEQLTWQALVSLYHPDILHQIKNNEAMTPADQTPLTSAELFKTVRNSIWSELNAKDKVGISARRRMLQKQHIDILTVLFRLSDMVGEPQDTRALARHDFTAILTSANQALAGKTVAIDEATRVHLKDIQAEIKQLLYPGK
ncbi:MAG: zinc-dependent metalloprotease [Elusimicrobia bacterium]|nr:zinc-dependent metalloprotease [Elusimicrobiota bacterium]